MVDIQDIEKAAKRLTGQILETPCVESRTLSEIVGAQVFLKFENLQFSASFKERGACNKLADLARSGARGVIAMSAGNHTRSVDIDWFSRPGDGSPRPASWMHCGRPDSRHPSNSARYRGRFTPESRNRRIPF
jgi:hypothetical protein